MYNFKELRGAIIAKFGTLKEFYKEIEWSEVTGSAKINGRIPFTKAERIATLKILGLPESDMDKFF